MRGHGYPALGFKSADKFKLLIFEPNLFSELVRVDVPFAEKSGGSEKVVFFSVFSFLERISIDEIEPVKQCKKELALAGIF